MFERADYRFTEPIGSKSLPVNYAALRNHLFCRVFGNSGYSRN